MEFFRFALCSFPYVIIPNIPWPQFFMHIDDGQDNLSWCPAVIAFGKTLYKCQEELRSSLEGWIIVKIRHGDDVPVIARINLKKSMPVPKEAVAHG